MPSIALDSPSPERALAWMNPISIFNKPPPLLVLIAFTASGKGILSCSAIICLIFSNTTTSKASYDDGLPFDSPPDI